MMYTLPVFMVFPYLSHIQYYFHIHQEYTFDEGIIHSVFNGVPVWGVFFIILFVSAALFLARRKYFKK